MASILMHLHADHAGSTAIIHPAQMHSGTNEKGAFSFLGIYSVFSVLLCDHPKNMVMSRSRVIPTNSYCTQVVGM